LKKILYICSLEKVGGHETALCDLLESETFQNNAINHLYALNNKVHFHLLKRLKKTQVSVSIARSSWGMNIPLSLSKLKYKWIEKRFRPSLIIFWNCIGSIKSKYKWLYDNDIPYLYFERGNIVSTTFDQNRLDFLNSAELIVANSFSSSRHIDLRFNPATRIKVCHSASGSAIQSNVNCNKSFSDGTFKIGICGRLVSIKGFAVVFHAVKLLKDRGHILELHVAGTGPEEKRLYHLASQLDVREQIFFHGLIDSNKMNSFYNSIHLLVIPSIRESFPRVAIEAQHMGCPVIVARIDGIPETIVEGVTGYSIPPSLNINQYIQMGGTNKGLPELVYDPDRDSLVPPKALNPEDLAEKIVLLLKNPDRYEKLSQNAHNIVKQRFDHENHFKTVWQIFQEVLSERQA